MPPAAGPQAIHRALSSAPGRIALLGHLLHVEITIADPRMGAAGGGTAKRHDDLVRTRGVSDRELGGQIVRAEAFVVLCINGFESSIRQARLLVKAR